MKAIWLLTQWYDERWVYRSRVKHENIKTQIIPILHLLIWLLCEGSEYSWLLKHGHLFFISTVGVFSPVSWEGTVHCQASLFVCQAAEHLDHFNDENMVKNNTRWSSWGFICSEVSPNSGDWNANTNHGKWDVKSIFQSVSFLIVYTYIMLYPCLCGYQMSYFAALYSR